MAKIVPTFIETRQTPRNHDCHLTLNPINDDEILMIPKHATIKNDKIYIYNTKKMQIDRLKNTTTNTFVSLYKDVLFNSHLAKKFNITFPTTQNQQHSLQTRARSTRNSRKRKQKHKYKETSDTRDQREWQIHVFAVQSINYNANIHQIDCHENCEPQSAIFLMANLCYGDESHTQEHSMWIHFDVIQKQFKLIQPTVDNNSRDQPPAPSNLFSHFSYIPNTRINLCTNILYDNWLFIMIGKKLGYCKIYVFKLDNNNNYYPIHVKTLNIPKEYQYTNQGFVIRNNIDDTSVQNVELILFGGFRKYESSRAYNSHGGYKEKNDLCRDIVQLHIKLPNISIIRISKIAIPCFCSQVKLFLIFRFLFLNIYRTHLFV